MTQTEYEQKKKECWKELWNDLIKDKDPVDFPTAGDIFEYVFPKAYALGKQEKDAEEEEVLTVSRKKVQEEYIENLTASNEVAHSYYEYGYYDGAMNTLTILFGSKCPPDNVATSAPNVDTLSVNVDISEEGKADPKLKMGDKVVFKNTGKIKVVAGMEDDGRYIVTTIDGNSPLWVRASDLEPYTEPETSHETPVCENHSDDTSQKDTNRNLSLNIADCDKQFDNILKDSFRNERRLNIATRIISAILSNQRMLNNLAHGETTVEGAVRCVVDATMMYTDALIAECEKGDSDGN